MWQPLSFRLGESCRWWIQKENNMSPFNHKSTKRQYYAPRGLFSKIHCAILLSATQSILRSVRGAEWRLRYIKASRNG